ncbi:hypothetical protein HK097_005007, partial [Rhizophlyctis rosea]
MNEAAVLPASLDQAASAGDGGADSLTAFNQTLLDISTLLGLQAEQTTGTPITFQESSNSQEQNQPLSTPSPLAQTVPDEQTDDPATPIFSLEALQREKEVLAKELEIKVKELADHNKLKERNRILEQAAAQYKLSDRKRRNEAISLQKQVAELKEAAAKGGPEPPSVQNDLSHIETEYAQFRIAAEQTQSTLEADIARLQKELQIITQTATTLKAQLHETNSRNNDLSSKLQHVTSDVQRLESAKAASEKGWKTKLEAWKAQNKKLEASRDEMRDLASTAKREKEESEKGWKTKLDACKVQNKKLEASRDEMRDLASAARREKEESEERAKRVEEDLRAQVRKLEAIVKELRDGKGEDRSSAGAGGVVSEKQLAKLRKENESLKKQKVKLRKENESLKKQKRVLQDTITKQLVKLQERERSEDSSSDE